MKILHQQLLMLCCLMLSAARQSTCYMQPLFLYFLSLTPRSAGLKCFGICSRLRKALPFSAAVLAQETERSCTDQKVRGLIPDPCSLHVKVQDTEPQIAPVGIAISV